MKFSDQGPGNHGTTDAAVESGGRGAAAGRAYRRPGGCGRDLGDIGVQGDFYNGLRTTRNLVLNLDSSSVSDVISSSTTRHVIDTSTAADYKQISEVTNTVGPTVNNGVLVNLKRGSSWTVTGPFHLSRLAISADSSVRAGHGKQLAMTVDGIPTPSSPERPTRARSRSPAATDLLRLPWLRPVVMRTRAVCRAFRMTEAHVTRWAPPTA